MGQVGVRKELGIVPKDATVASRIRYGKKKAKMQRAQEQIDPRNTEVQIGGWS